MQRAAPRRAAPRRAGVIEPVDCSDWATPLDVVQAVVETDLVPKALICDQSSTCQICIKSFHEDTRREQILNEEHLDNKLNINGHKLNIVYGPPYLIKGIRNNLLTKDMMFCGKLVRWADILEVFKSDCELRTIRLVPKLTDEHVIPSKIKETKVKNATQVLSERMSAMLYYTHRNMVSSRQDFLLQIFL